MRAVRTTSRLTLALCLVACVCGRVVQAQEVGTAVPGSSEGIRQASLSSSPSLMDARRGAAKNLQVRVKVQYLMVDAETREAIYQGLDRESIVSSVQTPPAIEKTILDESVSPVLSLQQIQAPSRVTTCTLSETELNEVLKKAADSPASQVNAAPNILLLDGNDVEMTDLIQRPFVIDFQLDGETIKPSVHVLDEGTRLRLVAHLTDPSAGLNQEIDFKCELTVMRVLDVKSDQVFGVKEEPLTVHLPFQQITSALATRRLGPGEALLVDPHADQNRSVARETSVPVLQKIPYVNRMFKNESKATLQQHMILLLRPSVEPMAN